MHHICFKYVEFWAYVARQVGQIKEWIDYEWLKQVDSLKKNDGSKNQWIKSF